MHSGTDTAVCASFRTLLRQQRADEDARQKTVRNLEKADRRTVGGGQTGQNEWEITGWRTGGTFANGTGGLKGYDEAAKRLDPARATQLQRALLVLVSIEVNR